jgi:hypothetical protein
MNYTYLIPIIHSAGGRACYSLKNNFIGKPMETWGRKAKGAKVQGS